jgi:FG-GAP-like repeat
VRGWSVLVAVVALLVPLSAAGAGGGPTFGPAKTVATHTGVGALTEIQDGDLNGDGIADLVVTRIAYPIALQTFPIGIYLGDGKGGYVDGSSLWDGPPARTEHGRQIIIADFNGDHRNDIFVADHGYDGPPYPGHANALALSTPAGKLVDASGNMPPESGFSHSATAADVNHDGSLDLYVGNIGGGDQTPPEILLNDGTGHFSRGVGLLPPELSDTEDVRYTRSLFVDVNGDGSPDLVLGADDRTPESEVLLNDGTGHFHKLAGAMPAKPFGPSAILISLATPEVNGDGHPDLLAGFTRSNPFYSGRFIQVLVNTGNGTFRDETAKRLPVQDQGDGWPEAIRVADVNGDGHLDFGVGVNGAYTERAPIYLDDGTGTYHPAPAPSSQPFFTFADANADGRPDLVSGSGGSTEQIDVQLQLALPATPTGLRATGLRDRVHLSWTTVPGATGYEIWRSAPRQALRRIGAPGTPAFDDRGAKRGVLYTYKVRAANELGKSALSKPATGRRR